MDKVGLRPWGRQGVLDIEGTGALPANVKEDSRRAGGAFCSINSFIQLRTLGHHKP